MKKKMLIVLLVLVFSLTLAIPAPALSQSSVWHVKPGGSGDGTSWAVACSLQHALDKAASGDEIWVAEGTYNPTSAEQPSEEDRSVSFELDSGEKVYGGFDGTETAREERDWVANPTILSGNIGNPDDNNDNSYHVVKSTSTNGAILNGFTITGGNANGEGEYDRGGGMYNYKSSPTVTNCIFSGNSADYGGGMCNYNSSSPTVTDCTFSGNPADYGGGMYNGAYNNNSSSPTVTDCIFSGNPADYGGGMLNYKSSPTVTDCTFSENSASYSGGGMYNNNSSSPTVTDCVFSENSASDLGLAGGGGMYNYDSSSPTVTNCIFSGNSGNCGGGMFNYNSSSANVTNCTFYGNSASYGGGMCNLGSSSPKVTNCILWNNSPQQILNNNSASVVSYSDIEGEYIGVNNNINADPEFVNPSAGDYHLKPSSPCIDAGWNDAPDLPATDFEGDPRIWPEGGVVDMGADEFVPEAELITATIDIKPDTLNLSSKGKWITCYIELPDDYDVAGINVSTLLLNEIVPAESKPTEIGDYDEDGITDLMVKFDREDLADVPAGDEVTLTVTGNLIDGPSFAGSDTIRVINTGD